MRPWLREILRGVGGSSVLVQERMDELLVERNRLAKRVRWLRAAIRSGRERRDDLLAVIEDRRSQFNRLSLDCAEYRHALGHVAVCDDNCGPCQDLARQTLELTGALSDHPTKDDALARRAHGLLDDVLGLISARECQGDIRESMIRLWGVLEEPIASRAVEQVRHD